MTATPGTRQRVLHRRRATVPSIICPGVPGKRCGQRGTVRWGLYRHDRCAPTLMCEDCTAVAALAGARRCGGCGDGPAHVTTFTRPPAGSGQAPTAAGSVFPR